MEDYFVKSRNELVKFDDYAQMEKKTRLAGNQNPYEDGSKKPVELNKYLAGLVEHEEK